MKNFNLKNIRVWAISIGVVIAGIVALLVQYFTGDQATALFSFIPAACLGTWLTGLKWKEYIVAVRELRAQFPSRWQERQKNGRERRVARGIEKAEGKERIKAFFAVEERSRVRAAVWFVRIALCGLFALVAFECGWIFAIVIPTGSEPVNALTVLILIFIYVISCMLSVYMLLYPANPNAVRSKWDNVLFYVRTSTTTAYVPYAYKSLLREHAFLGEVARTEGAPARVIAKVLWIHFKNVGIGSLFLLSCIPWLLFRFADNKTRLMTICAGVLSGIGGAVVYFLPGGFEVSNLNFWSMEASIFSIGLVLGNAIITSRDNGSVFTKKWEMPEYKPLEVPINN